MRNKSVEEQSEISMDIVTFFTLFIRNCIEHVHLLYMRALVVALVLVDKCSVHLHRFMICVIHIYIYILKFCEVKFSYIYIH
jgi:hypothetical protein